MLLISVLHWTLRLMLYTIFFSLVLPPPLVVSLYLSHVHSYSVHIHVHSIICVHTPSLRRHPNTIQHVVIHKRLGLPAPGKPSPVLSRTP
ncbi:hypothetical protein EDB83DRAFT_228734 [Lactarius deliciosus]|nr:hypothetical protein EDB83DRAFT_228734 [Lactarius deliciosus]